MDLAQAGASVLTVICHAMVPHHQQEGALVAAPRLCLAHKLVHDLQQRSACSQPVAESAGCEQLRALIAADSSISGVSALMPACRD